MRKLRKLNWEKAREWEREREQRERNWQRQSERDEAERLRLIEEQLRRPQHHRLEGD